MAISIKRLLKEGKIKRAVILDIDLHCGDGTANIFSSSPDVTYFHPEAYNRKEFMETLTRNLEGAKNYDITHRLVNFKDFDGKGKNQGLTPTF